MAGRVVAMRVAEGDSVRAGEVVAEIERAPLEDQQRQAKAAFSQAQAGLENARLNLARTERLFERGIARQGGRGRALPVRGGQAAWSTRPLSRRPTAAARAPYLPDLGRS